MSFLWGYLTLWGTPEEDQGKPFGQPETGGQRQPAGANQPSWRAAAELTGNSSLHLQPVPAPWHRLCPAVGKGLGFPEPGPIACCSLVVLAINSFQEGPERGFGWGQPIWNQVAPQLAPLAPAGLGPRLALAPAVAVTHAITFRFASAQPQIEFLAEEAKALLASQKGLCPADTPLSCSVQQLLQYPKSL